MLAIRMNRVEIDGTRQRESPSRDGPCHMLGSLPHVEESRFVLLEPAPKPLRVDELDRAFFHYVSSLPPGSIVRTCPYVSDLGIGQGEATVTVTDDRDETVLDASGLKCPLPVLKARKAMKQVAAGRRLCVLVTDPKAPEDFRHFCDTTGDTLESVEATNDGHRIVLRKSG